MGCPARFGKIRFKSFGGQASFQHFSALGLLGGNTMPRYVIERDIPDIGLADRKALREAAENISRHEYGTEDHSEGAFLYCRRQNIMYLHSR